MHPKRTTPIALAILIFASGVASAQVSDATRASLAEARKTYSELKLSKDAQGCLDGTEIDPDCDGLVAAETSLYVKTQQVNAREQQVNAREQQAKLAIESQESTSVVLALVQLALATFKDKPPPETANFLAEVPSKATTPSDVIALIKDYLARKSQGHRFTWAQDGQKLFDLADKHLDMAVKLRAQVTDETFQKQVQEMLTQAVLSLRMAKAIAQASR